MNVFKQYKGVVFNLAYTKTVVTERVKIICDVEGKDWYY